MRTIRATVPNWYSCSSLGSSTFMVLLGEQQDQAVAVQRRIDRFLGLGATDVQGYDHVGKDHDIAQDQYRQAVGDLDLVQFFLFFLLGR